MQRCLHMSSIYGLHLNDMIKKLSYHIWKITTIDIKYYPDQRRHQLLSDNYYSVPKNYLNIFFKYFIERVYSALL